MCGVAGVLRKYGSLGDKDFSRIATIVGSLQHRGPDAEDIQKVSETCLLGSTRLAITDPSNHRVDMPLQSRDGRYTIAFNGEIYNFKALQKAHVPGLESESDTRVLVELFALMGPDCLALLEGMYALLVHDRERDELFCAADPSGQKTLYLYEDSECILISSEIKPLIFLPGLTRTLAIPMIAEAVARRFIINSETHINEIRKVPAGYCGRLSESGVRLEQFYSIPVVKQDCADEADVIERFHQTMDAIAGEMFATDLPVAILLSGGIDSTAIAWMAHRYHSAVTAYSIGFEPAEGRTFEEGFGADEFSYGNLAAQHYGLGVENVRISQASYFDHFEEWIDSMGEPRCFNDAPALLALFKEIGKSHKIAFCGSGTDEILDGYSHYDGLPYGVSVESRAGSDFNAVVDCYFETDLRLYGVELSELLPRHDAKTIVLAKLKQLTAEYQGKNISGQQLVQLLMSRSRLVNYEFSQLDLTSMHSSVEARSPFGERRFMEFAFSFAPRLKAFAQNEKHILKQALRGHLPDEIVDRKKSPFPMPMQYFFCRSYEQRVEGFLGEGSPLARLGLVEPAMLRYMWEHEDPRYRPVFSRLYMLNRLLEQQLPYLDVTDGI